MVAAQNGVPRRLEQPSRTSSPPYGTAVSSAGTRSRSVERRKHSRIEGIGVTGDLLHTSEDTDGTGRTISLDLTGRVIAGGSSGLLGQPGTAQLRLGAFVSRAGLERTARCRPRSGLIPDGSGRGASDGSSGPRER